MKLHNQILLLGLINMILNLTSVSTQDNVFISWAYFYADFHNTSNCWVCGAMPLSVMDGLLGGCHHSTKEILNHSALFWDNKKRLSFLLSIIISPCSLGKPDLESTDLSHGVMFDVNTSFIEITKA